MKLPARLWGNKNGPDGGRANFQGKSTSMFTFYRTLNLSGILAITLVKLSGREIKKHLTQQIQ
jgi:hypothetical protein